MQEKPFWKEKSLAEMNRQEWEQLCDGCARCCLVKLDIKALGGVKYTNVSCRLLDTSTCTCTSYWNRHALVPRCLVLTPDRIEEFHWLPKTCAYRLLHEGNDLPLWHPLVCGNKDEMHSQGHSVIGRVVSEEYIHPSQLPEHVTDWE
jgi:uncharacterized protein